MAVMELRFFTNDASFPFFIQYGGHDDDVILHSHLDFYELVVVMDGSAKHIVDDESYDIQKGDVFVVGSDIRHGYSQPQNFKICNIMFKPDVFLGWDYDIKQSSGFHSLFILSPHLTPSQSFQNRMKLTSDSFIRLAGLIDLAIHEYESDKPGKKTISLAYFMQIVVELSREYTASKNPKKHKEIDGIANAAAYIESNYMNDITTEELLEISHYSQRHFIRLFSSLYNTTPQKYILSIRIRHACALLRDSDIHITEIALQCGFNDPNYFSRVFKKHTNVSPQQFRTSLLS